MQIHCADLVTRDSAFSAIVESAPLCPFSRTRPKSSHFESIVRAVIAQQVSTQAAITIRNRLEVIAGGVITAPALAALSVEQLQSAGLTGAKVRSLSELSNATVAGNIDFAHIARQPDDVVIAELTSIFGIGVWTAHMFLMFQLGRLDVWPTGDLAVRRGWDVLHNSPTVKTPKARVTEAGRVSRTDTGTTPAGVTARQLDELGARFAGIRSVAAWYCWRAS